MERKTCYKKQICIAITAVCLPQKIVTKSQYLTVWRAVGRINAS